MWLIKNHFLLVTQSFRVILRLVNPKIIASFLLIILLASAFQHLGAASRKVPPSPQPTLEADDITFDEKTRVSQLKGNAILRSSSFILSADKILWNNEKSTAEAKGDAIFTGYDLRVLAKRIVIHFQTGEVMAENLKVGYYPWVLEAEKFASEARDNQKSSARFRFSEVELFSRNKSQASPSLHMESMTLDGNSSKFIAKSIGVKLGDKTFFKIPNLRGNLNQSALDYNLRAGKRSSVGWYLGAKRTWAVREYSDFTLSALMFPERGIYFSPILKGNQLPVTEEFYDYSVRMGGIVDYGDERGMDRLGEAIPRNRGLVDVNFIRRISERWRFAGQMFANTDSELYRDFQSDRFAHDQWRQNFGELSYEGPVYSISTLSQWQQNDYDSLIEQSPNLRIDAGPAPVFGAKFSHSLALEYAILKEKTSHGITGEESRKLDLGYKMQRPFSLPMGLRYVPSLAFRAQSFDLANQGNAKRQLGEWGNDLYIQLLGSYEVHNKIWEIERIDHISGFSLRHRRRTLMHQSNLSNIPLLDNPFADLNLSPIDLLEEIEADGLKPHEILRLEWTNRLIGSYQGANRELMSFNLFQDLWSNDRYENAKPHSYGEIDLSPAPWLTFSAQSKVDLDTGQSLRNSLTCRIRDGRINDLSVTYFKFDDFGEEWQVFLTRRLDSRKQIAMGVRFDEETSQVPYWMGEIKYRPKGDWTLGIAISQREGTAKEDELAIALNANLFSF